MNPYCRHLLQIALAAIAVIMVMVIATVVIDPYRVFGLTRLNTKNFLPNTRYLQIEHLKQNPVDCVILGTSRVNYYQVEDVHKLTGMSAFNLTTPAGTLQETRMELEWLLQHQKPKQLIIGLDYDIQFLVDRPVESYLLKWSHPEVTGTPLWKWRMEYLKFDVESTWLAFKRNFLEWKVTRTYEDETGQFTQPKREEDIRTDWAAYEAAQFKPLPKNPRRAQSIHEEDLRRMVALIREKGIKTHFIIHPMHRLNMESFDAEDFQALKQRVTAICGQVHDFSTDPALTQDNHLYYEHVHFLAEVGRKVLEKILSP